MIEEEKMGSHQKAFLKLKCLSPFKMLISPLFEETFGAFLFLPPFFLPLFSNGFNILAVESYFRLELCAPTWLNHDYGDGGGGCGYIDGGHIFRSGCMHANIYG
jgi:hypothetical protein